MQSATEITESPYILIKRSYNLFYLLKDTKNPKFEKAMPGCAGQELANKHAINIE